MINRVTLIGNLGRDPETRSTAGGGTVCTLAVATSERVKDQSGNWTDHTEWHRVTCFGTTAENAAKFLSKGRQVYVEGKLRTSKYQAKDGTEKSSTEIVADTLKFLGGQPGEARRDAPPPRSNPTTRAPSDDVPF
jgi:single-strand DNA-binding protein